MCVAMEADPFEQPYWNLDQYLIWLASRDPAAALRATDRPNSGANPPNGWYVYVHRESNVDRQKVEMEALRAIKGGNIKVCVEFNGRWFTNTSLRANLSREEPDAGMPHVLVCVDPEWFADWVIEFEGESTFAALLMRTTTHGRREKYRPRFDPQSIVQRYRARTLSNVCYRPDDPGVGRFIAYSDVWNWLAERISLQELLPIDEAGSRAEDTIRDICMNTPEKLTMWGFRKADPAEPKSIIPQAWQGLSINPLYDRATKGDGGPVIWTGPCFDRKEFVAAFVAAPQPAGRRGARPKVDWRAMEEAFRRRVAERGRPDELNVDGWQTQADVERWLRDMIRREKVEISEATLRRRAKDFLFRARKGS